MVAMFNVSDFPRVAEMPAPCGLHVGAQLAVVLDGELVLDTATGVARPGVTMDSATIVPWMSSTKVVTAICLLQLWERGDVGLDDRVADHLDAFGGLGKEEITIRHLLTHTAGLGQADRTVAEMRPFPQSRTTAQLEIAGRV